LGKKFRYVSTHPQITVSLLAFGGHGGKPIFPRKPANVKKKQNNEPISIDGTLITYLLP